MTARLRAAALAVAVLLLAACTSMPTSGPVMRSDVVVNDPASRSRSGVRRTYDRAQLEAAWLGGSGGTVYVIHDGAHALP